MKYILGFLLLVLGANAQASEQIHMQISSATYATIKVTSGTVTQVDNFTVLTATTPLKGGIIFGRNEIFVENTDASNSMWCAFDNAVSTNTPLNSNGGKKFSPGTTRNIALGTKMSYFCKADDASGASGIRVYVEQATWR